jgi:hypothetical protein
MPSIESGTTADVQWLPRSSASAARQRQVLADRQVEAAPPAGPRNPVLRAFAHLGWVLSHKLASALPALRRHFSAGARAADNTRELLRSTLEQLASGDATPAQLAAHVRKLARAKSEWARRDPEAQGDFFDRAVEQTLDTHWPHDRGIALIEAINGEKCAECQRLLGATDPGNEQLLMQLATSIDGVVYQRAFDTIDAEFRAALAVIRDDSLSSLIELHAEQAVQHSVAILRQLRDCRVLEPLPREESAAADSSRQEAVRTVEILESRLEALEAKEEDIGRLIRPLSLDSLGALHLGSQTGGRIGPAVANELHRRTQDLWRELEEAVQTSSRPEDKLRRERSVEVLKADLARINRLAIKAQEHDRAFPAPGSSPQLASPQLAGALQAADEFIVTASRSDVIFSLKREAKAHIQALGDCLVAGESRGRVNAWLPNVKKVTAVLHAYLNAIEPTDAAGPEDRFTQQFELLLEETVSDLTHQGRAEGRAAAVYSAMQQPEVRGLLSVLREAAKQAAAEHLPELQADLEHACQALSSTQRFAARRMGKPSPEDKRRDSPKRRSPPETRGLSDDSRAALEDLYSTVIESDGRVRLTAGQCSPAFAAYMTRAIEMPFSESELAQTQLPGGTLVPSQFCLDAKRGMIYLGHDGERLIDPRGWERLTLEQRDRRIEEGYLRLVAFYQGNTTQTDLILRNANQTLVAGFQEASQNATDTPVVLSDFGIGVLAGTGLNGTHETVVRFKTGENQRPRLELSYEVRGGVIRPQSRNPMAEADEAQSPKRYLDLAQSRAKITVVAEAARDGLKVIGTPTYDVRLKRNWARRPYPYPKRQHLLAPMNTIELYGDLNEFAKQYDPDTKNTLMALQDLSRVNASTSSVELSGRLWGLYLRHLRAGASAPLPAALDGSPHRTALLTLMDELEPQARGLFAAGEAAARERIQAIAADHPGSIPEPVLTEASRLEEFLSQTEQWRNNPDGRHAQYLKLQQSLMEPSAPPLFGPLILRQILDQSNALLAGLEPARSLVEPLCQELAAQLPDTLFSAFATYIKSEYPNE